VDKIIVILPVYNGMQYLKQNIESVLSQTYSNFKFFILDDCSTDGSWEYLCSVNDSRITLIQNDVNRGLFFNLNYLISNSNEELIKLWAQDDIMYETCLDETVKFHIKFQEIGFSYSDRHIIDEKGEVYNTHQNVDLTPEVVSTKLHTQIAFFVGSIAGNIANVTIVRNAIVKVGLFNEKMKISADFEMWVRIAQYFPVGHIKKPLIQLRNHKDQLSRQEEYFIFHIKEDIEIYNYLISYIDEKERLIGRYYLRNYKLLFYYTLMLKALFKGKFNTFYKFYFILNKFENIYVLTMLFVKNKIVFKNENKRSYMDNTKFYEYYNN